MGICLLSNLCHEFLKNVADRTYGDFKKPSAFQNTGEANDTPAHYTPSPLAVPSPNWSVIDSYIGKEIIR